MKQEHIAQVEAAVSAIAAKKTINHFYFAACGGSMAFLQPAEFIFGRESVIPASLYTANEFVHAMPKALGPDSVFISCSHSGTTPETVKATELARKAGATTISFSNLEGSPLWNACEYPIHYDWGEQALDASDLNKGVLYSLIFRTLNALEPCDKYVRGVAALDSLDAVTKRAKAAYADWSAKWGKEFKREPLIYSMGSGSCTGECYSFSACLLMEMQWINSSFIHSGEYFHGPFEITDYDVPFVLVKNVGSTRELDERAYNFCSKYSQKIALVDAADFDMTGIDEDLREYYAPLIVGPVLRQLADALAYERGHLLSVRRYMWRMEY
jgi:fructoselysine 6-phosphate deglycase